MDDFDIHSDLGSGLRGPSSANLSAVADGDMVQARGWFESDNGTYFLCPPHIEDLVRPGRAPRSVGPEALRLLLSEGEFEVPSGSWVCISGVWVERQITVSSMAIEPIDLSLIEPPEEVTDTSAQIDEKMAKNARRTFADRYRRWDLLTLGRGRADGRWPVLYVAGTRALDEIQDYLDTLPTGMVHFRSWLEAIDAGQGN